MRILPAFALCLLAASGCASSVNSRATREITPQTLDMSGAGNLSLTYVSENARGHAFALNAPVEKVWAALPLVFQMLEMDAGVVNANGRIFGNPNFRVRGRLAGERPSHFVDCGKSPIGVPLATNEPLQLSILAGLVPAADGVTRVEVKIQGIATTASTSSQSPCATTGALEDRIQKLLVAHLSA